MSKQSPFGRSGYFWWWESETHANARLGRDTCMVSFEGTVRTARMTTTAGKQWSSISSNQSATIPTKVMRLGVSMEGIDRVLAIVLRLEKLIFNP